MLARLPWELIDDILVLTGNFLLALQLKRFYAAKKLFNPMIHTWEFASKYDHLDILKFLHDNRIGGCSFKAMDRAIQGGRLDIVKFFFYNRTEKCSVNAVDLASENGHFDIVEFLHINGTVDAMNYASLNGYLKIVEFLHF